MSTSASSAAATNSSTVAPDALSIPAAEAAKSTTRATNPLWRFGAWLYERLPSPRPLGVHLRRRDRAVRYYRRQARGRIRVHRVTLAVSIVTCIIGVGLTLAFFFAGFRSYFPDNSPFGGITFLCALFSAAVAIYAYIQLRGIRKEAYRFAQFYLDSTNDDGTINVDPSSDHDYGDRAMNGRVYVRMSDVYKWFCKDV